MPYTWAPAPPLPQPHAHALTAALESLHGRDGLLAVLLCGSVVRDEGGPTSDLDLYCLIDRPVRQRRHLVAASGVLVEIFLNPAGQIRRYLADERVRNRPSTAHMLVTGHALLDRRPEVTAALRAEAAALLQAGPDALSGTERHLRIYGVRDLFEDAVDTTVDTALMYSQCLLAAVQLHYALRRRWEPKMKRLPADLRQWDPGGADLLAAYAARPSLRSLRALVEHVLIDEGGLPIRSWDMPEEPVPD